MTYQTLQRNKTIFIKLQNLFCRTVSRLHMKAKKGTLFRVKIVRVSVESEFGILIQI
jgi:hypothetical protein